MRGVAPPRRRRRAEHRTAATSRSPRRSSPSDRISSRQPSATSAAARRRVARAAGAGRGASPTNRSRRSTSRYADVVPLARRCCASTTRPASGCSIAAAALAPAAPAGRAQPRRRRHQRQRPARRARPGDARRATSTRSCAASPGQWPLPVWSRVIAERRATYACTPGRARPAAGRVRRGLYLAGDYTDAEFPATLEAATRSGVPRPRARRRSRWARRRVRRPRERQLNPGQSSQCPNTRVSHPTRATLNRAAFPRPRRRELPRRRARRDGDGVDGRDDVEVGVRRRPHGAFRTRCAHVPRAAPVRLRSSRCCSRFHSRSLIVARLSYCFLPLASPTSSLTRPLL